MPLNPIICHLVVCIINLQPAEFLPSEGRILTVHPWCSLHSRTGDLLTITVAYRGTPVPSTSHSGERNSQSSSAAGSGVWRRWLSVLQRPCFLVHHPPKNSWIQPDCWCILQCLLCVLFMKNRKRARSEHRNAGSGIEGILAGFCFLTSMKQFIVLQFSKAAWLLICFRL